jgi:Na+:H+ antiporter, NhaA family
MTLQPPVDRAADHIRGDPGAPATLLEYGDFQCPYCGDAFLIVEEVRRRLGDRLRFVFRHFPVAEKHPQAELAAQAAEAAGAQGRFWEMHDRLYRARRRLELEDLREYAQELELDLERFDAELAGEVHLGRVREQRASGERSGVTSTPAFFVGDEQHAGFYDEETLTEALSSGPGGEQ